MKTNLLTKKEHEYLSAVIKPFREDVLEIVKKCYGGGVNCIDDQWLVICLNDLEVISLPCFEFNKYYKKLELQKHYTLEELGL